MAIVAIGSYYVFSYFAVQSTFSKDDISNNLKFDKDIWQNGTSRQRGQMVNYLLDSIGIVGRSKDNLRTLIGEPDSQINLEDGDYKSKFLYSVDKGHAFVYDMIILFDSTEHAKDVIFDD